MDKYEAEKMSMNKLEIAVTNINFSAAFDAATAALLNDPKNIKPNEEYREMLKNMQKNQYFRQFANAYQRKLNKVLEKHYNEAAIKNAPKPKKGKAKQAPIPAYGDMVLRHLSTKQVYRR